MSKSWEKDISYPYLDILPNRWLRMEVLRIRIGITPAVTNSVIKSGLMQPDGKCMCKMGMKCNILHILLDCRKCLHLRKLFLRQIFLKYDVKAHLQAWELPADMENLDIAIAIGKVP